MYILSWSYGFVNTKGEKMRIQEKKLNKYQSQQERSDRMERIQHGEGLFVYKNRTNGDLSLPKPTQSGQKVVGPGQEWQGDNYYMAMVPQEAIIVRTIITPQQQKEMKMQEEKLILDQPDKVTTEGMVEHVVKKIPESLNEVEEDQTLKSDTLINEDPMDGVQIIRN